MEESVKASDLRKLLGRLDADCLRAFQGATALCQSRTHFEVTPDHLLLRLLDATTGDVALILSTFKVESGHVRRAVQQALDDLPAGHTGKPALSPKIVELFQSAGVCADQLGLDEVRTGLILMAFALNPSHARVYEFSSELGRIDIDQLRDHFLDIIQGSQEQSTAPGTASREELTAGCALDQYTIDLTTKARAGQIDPVFGRDHEIRQLIDIFARRRKNNPILAGEPGTGKTAIVEGLALRIVEGDVPPTLQGVKLVCLDLGLLQAGAGVKGEFENRLKNVIKEIKESKQPIVTFIDEAHTLIGAGGGPGGSDAANLLKPALARGELRTVAATTWAEYKKYFEKDAALERRFQIVRCDEPSADDAIVMLRGLKEKYESHHNVVILDEAVDAAVKLSKRYISGRFLPDKAVDLLDTAAARVAVGVSTQPAALEDIDRRISYLETAIAAVRRDCDGGYAAAEASISEMEAVRDSLLTERVSIEQRWESEREAVQKLTHLRSRLTAYRTPCSDASEEGEACPQSEGPPDDVGGGEQDEGELRSQIAAAIAALREIQGETPLIFPQVDAKPVAAVVADWTGIPVGAMLKDEAAAALEMEDRLRKRVVGQDQAISMICEKLRTAKAGLRNPVQPLGVFLCVGPSGVGKTELALAIADELFGGEQFLTSINMSEFMESHTASQLKGSPPGYVGYGEGGVLTEAVRHHPYSVVLLDEVEKAHPDVLNLFYQVFDKGSLADGEGRVVDFSNTVIMLTSNLGTDAIQDLCEADEEIDIQDLRDAIHPHLREHFKPALVARMTVLPFRTLGDDILKTITSIKLAMLEARLLDAHSVALHVEDSVYQAVVDRCQQVDVGARQIDHLLDQKVVPEISRLILRALSEDAVPASVMLRAATDGEFCCEGST